jgi:hypothetical protein
VKQTQRRERGVRQRCHHKKMDHAYKSFINIYQYLFYTSVLIQSLPQLRLIGG